MMRTIERIIALCLLVIAVIPSSAQSSDRKAEEALVLGSEITPEDTSGTRRFTNRLIVPKGDWQCGLTIMYADYNSDDADYMLMLQGLDARASMFMIAPEASYAFRHNHSIGVRFSYTKLGGMLDAATADLLGNMSLSVNDIRATSNSMGGSVYQRTYVGIDRQGRFGIFWDYILGYTRARTDFSTGGQTSSYSIKEKVNLAFAPGVVYFPMNNISVQAKISLADVSYARTTAYADGTVAGTHRGANVQAGLNLLNLSFGLTIHL